MTHLYHYASASLGEFDKIRTARNLAHKNGENIRSKYPSYVDHVSFFMSSVPVSAVAALYAARGHTHPFWYTGHELYEYSIDTGRIIPHGFEYDIVESPEKTTLYYDDTVTEKQYHDRMSVYDKELGYHGTSPQELAKAVSAFLARSHRGYVLETYRALMHRPNFEEVKNKYAPSVPHVMLYDEVGEFNIASVKKITIGNMAREAIRVERPTFLRW
jgi:hypothetical protein